MKKILYLVTEVSYFCSHRLELASFVKQQGYEVAVATKCSTSNLQYIQAIKNQKVQLFELQWFNRTSFINPFKEFLAFKELYNIYKAFAPDVVHHVALKPIIYGTIIAQFIGVKKIINALAGLGFIFTDIKYNNRFKNIKLKFKQRFLQIIVSKFFSFIFNNKNNNKILLLQNQDDFNHLMHFIDPIKLKCVSKIIAGSGVIVDKYFVVQPLDNIDYNIKIVLVSRLLWTKGILEFVEAAAKIKNYIKENNLLINPEFIIYGDIDFKNPAAVDYESLNLWQKQGLIVWKHFCSNIIEAYSKCHIAVLPSYREGLPKSLIEAALCARAIITTDVPGCREIVEQGLNGYLIPKQNSDALAEALLNLMENPHLIIKMGISGREKVFNTFSAKVIFPKMLDLYAAI